MTEASDPAFPRPYSSSQIDRFQGQDGMTLREYFAAKALQGLLARIHGESVESACIIAVASADRLIQELNKCPE